MNGDWIGKSAVAAFIAISCLLIGLEIHGNQPFKQQQIEQNPRYPQAQNERPEEPQIGVLATPTQSSHEAHYSRHASETRDGSSEKQDWIILGDGAAQWLMVLASIGALGVSIWAVCLLKETLKATRHTIRLGVKANAAAVKASEAANEANLIMREDQRPWVTLEPVYRCEFRDHDFRCEFYWNYQFANKGKTPAIHPELRWKMFKIDNLLEIQGLIEGYIDIQDWTYSNKRDILFAGEKTNFFKIPDGGSMKYNSEQTAPYGKWTILLAVIRYQKSSNPTDIGIDAHSFFVEERPHFIGPRATKLLRHRHIVI